MPWRWHSHPTVWLVLGTSLLLYLVAVVAEGRRHRAGGGFGRATSIMQVVSFVLGVFTLELGADWPMHDLAERYLYSVHMVQHILFSFVAPPLLLLGVPAWLARRLLRPPHLRRVVFRVTRPLPALVLFNAVVVVTHWPALVDITLRSEPAHFFAHLALFSTAMIMWMAVVSPLPEFPRLSSPARCVYLFLQSIIPTVPASFLTFATHPIYKFYGHVPRLWGLGATEDQRIAGLIMKLGGGLLLWMLIGVVFFSWYVEEERADARHSPRRLVRNPGPMSRSGSGER
jgi:putative membrane protein